MGRILPVAVAIILVVAIALSALVLISDHRAGIMHDDAPWCPVGEENDE
jgi:hypothetical protein